MKHTKIIWIYLCCTWACITYADNIHSHSLTAEQWHRDVYEKVVLYEHYANSQLLPYFNKARMPYPPKKIAFLIFKREKRLDLWAKACGDWHYIRSYHVRAAHGGPGPKLYRGDCQVPEGIYSIIELNPYSKFHLSMEINYPNYFDRMEAKQDHRVNLGNYIFIHGGNLSQGCIAMGDHVIEQLYVLVYKVGKQNVSIVIAPNDMRIEKPFMRHLHPPWLPTLYHHLAEVLQHFPEQRVLF